MTTSLNGLWFVIGESGSRLTSSEIMQITQALACLGCTNGGWLWNVLEQFEDLEDYQGLDPSPQCYEDYEEIFEGIHLSAAEAWQAIQLIASVQLSKHLVALIK